MNLHDPQRPCLANGRPLWQNSRVAVPNINIFPLPSGQIRFSLMLPIGSEAFASSDFEIIVERSQLSSLISEFESDPETFCETRFKSEYIDLKLNLRDKTWMDIREEENESEKKISKSKPKPKSKVSDFSDIEI